MNYKFYLIILILIILTIIYINQTKLVNENFSQQFIKPPEKEALEEPVLEKMPYNNKQGRRLRFKKENISERDILYKCQLSALPCGNNKVAGSDGRCTTNKNDDTDFNNCDKAFGTIGKEPNGNYGFWSPDDGKCYSDCYDPSGNLI